MQALYDTGKIWLRGLVKPEYAVRAGDLYFVIGEEDSQSTKYLLYKNYLFVAIHYPQSQSRLFRRFSLDLESKSKGSLFSGFTKTKHADIKAITYRDDGVEDYLAKEKDYFLDKDGEIDPIKIMKLSGWK
jgi:hypothetical protein|tara:strand:+ start:792 stop:1181 length:390 start_codon:yes stop_codon:yes gene_type:complete